MIYTNKKYKMMKLIRLTIFSLLFSISGLNAQSRVQITDPTATEVWSPAPRKVTPGEGTAAPSDAIVLFDGKSTDEWTHADGSSVKWTLDSQGAMTITPKTGDIKTKRTFGDVQLHLEFRTPVVVKGEGQGRGNSGVFLQGIYEVQLLDSYNNRTYSNGQAAAIYKQSMPLVNACRPPGEWQTYDIVYKAPKFNKDGIKMESARITVIHNGVLVQNNTEILGTTPYIGLPENKAHGNGPIILQDHGDLLSFRNIWIREL